jgi:hypothetical protein
MKPATRNAIEKTATGLAAVAVCLGVFSWYLQPEFLLTLANQVWACF